ncbi:DNA mismatch repair protein MSH7 isoform X2 [Carica papaya]|uniref:DNA mismatch repair protein MSH7 isoform X2 n=1 Tax=Carica papaya TaxID=3649 RepID=UPI000B8D14AB|nr:DNA mismatch repair protein MSH7 isoform X2 [Carica papaya]
MQRQRSILSFLQKPSAANQGSGAGEKIERSGAIQFPEKLQNRNDAILKRPVVHDVVHSSLEIKGTDTPPEKVPRQVFPAVFKADKATNGSLFSSIMHKFVKVEDRENASGRNHGSAASSDVSSISTDVKGRSKHEVSVQPCGRDNSFSSNVVEVASRPSGQENGFSSRRVLDGGRELEIGCDDGVFGPKTPGMQRCVPRLKRIQDDGSKFGGKGHCLIDSSKRSRLLEDTVSGKKNHLEEADSVSKFEWLEPGRVKDASGRRPDDPLYDKRTLYIPPDALKKMSASQRQYWTVKCQYMDVVLFFKVGKFYELYELDAEIGHKELDWKMTISGVGKCRQVGISESGIDDAVQKLVARGYKVGRMEQLETSDQAKARGANSVIARKLVHVVTPSTTTDSSIGPDAVHLLSIKEVKNELDNGSVVYGFAFVDCAALRIWVGSIEDDASCAALGALLMQVSPKEVIYEGRGLSKEAQKALKKYSLTGSTAAQLTSSLPVDFVDASEVRNMIQMKGFFKGTSNLWHCALNGVTHEDLALCALGGLVDHLSRLMLDDVLRNGDILPYHVYTGCLRMDGQTMVNLEIFNNSADGGPSGTLYKYLDNCLTTSGKRLLRSWICHPLKNVDSINSRLDVVEALMAHSEILQLVSQSLRKLPDLDRLLGRVKASIQSSATLLLPMVGKKVLKQRVKAFGSLIKGLRNGLDLLMLLQKQGHVISLLHKVFRLPMLGGNDGLDKFLAQFEAAIDSDFPDYQNHAVTDKDAEILSILIELFTEKATQWSEVIHAISCIDVLRSFAVTGITSSGAMTRPVVLPESKFSTLNQETRGPVLRIGRLWHPFALGENGALPVPNDILLGEDSDGCHPCCLLLTGPNMGGKSTLLRATCLAVILAQLGCFVPCEMCILSLVDIIFTRLGATDRIMTGESTFMVECTETASVLQNATRNSLVLLDELGRGTSTFDGYAIAFAEFIPKEITYLTCATS